MFSLGLPGALRSITVYDLIHCAALFEFGVLALTFCIVIAILSIRAAAFIVGVTLDHSFPGWRAYVAGGKPSTSVAMPEQKVSS